MQASRTRDDGHWHCILSLSLHFLELCALALNMVSFRQSLVKVRKASPLLNTGVSYGSPQQLDTAPLIAWGLLTCMDCLEEEPTRPQGKYGVQRATRSKEAWCGCR